MGTEGRRGMAALMKAMMDSVAAAGEEETHAPIPGLPCRGAVIDSMCGVSDPMRAMPGESCRKAMASQASGTIAGIRYS